MHRLRARRRRPRAALRETAQGVGRARRRCAHLPARRRPRPRRRCAAPPADEPAHPGERLGGRPDPRLGGPGPGPLGSGQRGELAAAARAPRHRLAAQRGGAGRLPQHGGAAPRRPLRLPAAPAASDSQAAVHISLLKSRLAEAARDNERLRTETKRLSTRVGEHTKERERLAGELAETTEELESSRAELYAARHELAWLRRRLQEEGRFRLAAERPPADPRQSPPQKVEELLDRITDEQTLPNLFFTIEDRDTVRELTGSRKEGLWVTRAWEALLALDDYARYQLEHPSSGLGFHDYLREPPDGYAAIPVRRLASRESDTVRNRDKFSDKRVFRVPQEVSPDGEVTMLAHIKLDSEYGICPRLYFYPDLGPGTTNRIYIGYLGRHLPVQGTN
ncbi:hypothetical protein ACFQXA_16540 [Nocardiopsis composta]